MGRRRGHSTILATLASGTTKDAEELKMQNLKIVVEVHTFSTTNKR